MSSNGREVEIKLPVAGPVTARRRLRLAGFRISKRRVLERNTAYDTPSGELRNSARLLRVREAGKSCKLTYKGPPAVDRHKSREEIELRLPDADSFPAILQRLGYVPSFRYEKYRTEYERPGSKGVATLDETPIGIFMELEGEPGWIDRTARKLGYEEKDYITASYARLFQEWRERTGFTGADMLFQVIRNQRAGN